MRRVIVPLFVLPLVFALSAAAPPREPVETTFSELTKSLLPDTIESADYLRRVGTDRLNTAETEAAIAPNLEFLEHFRTLYADLDDGFTYRNYRPVLIGGAVDWTEAGSVLGLALAAGDLDDRAGRPVSAMRYYLGVLNFAISTFSGRGIAGEQAKASVAAPLVRLLERHFSRTNHDAASLAKLGDYFAYFAQGLFGLERMYESERVQILGRYFPMYKDDLNRELLIDQGIEDVFPEITQTETFWKFKEAEGLLLQYHRFSRLPFSKRLVRFRALERERAKNRSVGRFLGSQLTLMVELETAAAKFDLVALLMTCEAYRARTGRWPADAKELAAAGAKVPADRFADGAPLRIVGKGGFLCLYSVGANQIDDIYSKDDIVLRVVKD